MPDAMPWITILGCVSVVVAVCWATIAMIKRWFMQRRVASGLTGGARKPPAARGWGGPPNPPGRSPPGCRFPCRQLGKEADDATAVG